MPALDYFVNIEYCTNLFKRIQQYISVDHVVVDHDKKYYNHENPWYDKHVDDDSKKICTCNCRNGEHCEIEQDPNINPKHIIYVLKSLGEDLDEQVFPKNCQVVLKNNSGQLQFYGHRGSDHLDLTLDCYEFINLQNNTLGDLADSFYRVKSNKFDSHFETFDRVVDVTFDNNVYDKNHNNDDSDGNEKTSTIMIQIRFKHFHDNNDDGDDDIPPLPLDDNVQNEIKLKVQDAENGEQNNEDSSENDDEEDEIDLDEVD